MSLLSSIPIVGSLFKTPAPTASSTLDPSAQTAEASALTTAQNLNTKGYTPFTGQQVAPTSANQNTAIANPQNSGVLKNYLTPAASLATSAGVPNTNTYSATPVTYDNVSTDLWNGGAAQRYMNPYIGSVLQPVLTQIQKASTTAANQIGSAAAAHNAFDGAGTDRQMDANNFNTTNQVANSTNQVYSDAYNTGLSAFLADQARKLGADTTNQQADINTGEYNNTAGQTAFTENANVANQNAQNELAASAQLGNLGNDQVALHQANVSDLLQTGGVAQTTQQAQDTANYQAFLDMLSKQPGGQQYLDNLLNIVSAGKGGQTTTPGVSDASQLTGMIAAIMGASNSGTPGTPATATPAK